MEKELFDEYGWACKTIFRRYDSLCNYLDLNAQKVGDKESDRYNHEIYFLENNSRVYLSYERKKIRVVVQGERSFGIAEALRYLFSKKAF
jgi:hypothetical protein